MNQLIISKEDLKFNIEEIKKRAKDKKIIAVVKGNGYGLGLIEFCSFLKDNGIDFFAVSDIDDALFLRENDFNEKLLLLSEVSDEEKLKELVKKDVILTVGSIFQANLLAKVANELEIRPKAHIKIDTGFGRFGFLESETEKIFKILELPIEFEGIYTHFSNSFGRDKKDTKAQFDKFMGVINKLGEKGFKPLAHAANSSAFLNYEEMHLDAVRIGSAFLGRAMSNKKEKFKKIAYLKSNVIDVKVLPKNFNIGYANTFKTKKETKIAVVPVGYMHGFMVEKSKDTFRVLDILRYILSDLKLLKNGRKVAKINGKNYNILGRVGMYNVIIDITNSSVGIGDECIFNVNPILVNALVERKYV